MPFLPLVGKTRKPKFELHLKIYDLNNVPLVSGRSYIKWHLTHSMHAEHRGRTGKCPITNHRVDYNFNKVVPSVRISIDKNNYLSECQLELEVLQEFPAAEKITLGNVRINLSEYVEESEGFAREFTSPARQMSNASAISQTDNNSVAVDERLAQDGIIRRHLMQDSKVNSTLKISILMIQLDGERSYCAPPLKTAPVFVGIAGFMGPEQAEDETCPLPTISKGRDVSEIQDLYRRTLAASWSRHPYELPADECIEDIFSGGNGWRTKRDAQSRAGTATDDDDDLETDADAGQSTLRPGDFRRLAAQQQQQQQHHHHHLHLHHLLGQRSQHQLHHRRAHSGSSDRSTSTVTGRGGAGASPKKNVRIAGSRGGSAGAGPARRVRELDESDLREDLVAWKLPSVAA
ncbi:hypothetical protein HIM_04929 [Hirsutella minnesotensis 3608]|uniref:C2 NT-type domain-containing protein n=1 Tax=Hirsutella minnesotensis 3608 TaxID=1043627 RepID=A0A0F8A113_9HYPO|nr:hypothetical protein HIM_04929 [Hirsutella minnesotensis 3608]